MERKDAENKQAQEQTRTELALIKDMINTLHIKMMQEKSKVNKETEERNNERTEVQRPITYANAVCLENARQQHYECPTIIRAASRRTGEYEGTRLRTQPRIQRGIAAASNGRLRAANKTAWLYVGRLNLDITTNDVTDYLKGKGLENGVKCEELNTRGENKAFHVGIPFEKMKRTTQPFGLRV